MRGCLFWLSVFLSSIASGNALACSYPDLAPFEIDGSVGDDTPPPAPEASVERIKRGKGPTRDGCSYEDDSCASTAYVLLNVAAGEDEVGFVLQLSGDVPAGLPQRVNDRPVIPMHEPGQLRLTWEDGEGEDSLDFEVAIWSVDRAGNMSETPVRLQVRNEGSGGCSASQGAAVNGWFVLVCALGLVRRRRGAAL